ncbi:MAG: T9SS type A sorting domain-containing protein, partial [candidate division Zixibacteria bacterium]|nr:T9SS type A sorting domain-containing protein [candidate division Zixibacteria bacterium]
FNTLKHMDHLHGYWFNMDAEDTLYLEGACVDAETPIALEMGWNLVSYLPEEADSVHNALACILDKVIVVLGFDNGAQTYVPTMKEFSTLTMLRPLFGYWIKMTADDYLVYGGCYNPAFAKEGIDQHTNNMNAVTPTNIWHDLYGEAVIVEGNLLPAGTVIEAVDLNGSLVGSCVAQAEGKFGFMSVYGAEEDGAGLKVGDEFQLRIDGRLSEEVFTFEGTGSRTFVGNINLKSGGSAVIPEQYNLAQNYPNPFNPVTSIAYEIPSDCKVTLTVYNILGEKVTTLIDQHQSAGAYTVEWNGETDAGSKVSSGIYFYRLNAGDYTKSMKMTLMK